MSCLVTHPTSLSWDLHPTKGSAWAEAWTVCLSGEQVVTPVSLDLPAIQLQIYTIFIYTILFAWFFLKNIYRKSMNSCGFWVYRGHLRDKSPTDFTDDTDFISDHGLNGLNGCHAEDAILNHKLALIKRIPSGRVLDWKKHEKHPRDIRRRFATYDVSLSWSYGRQLHSTKKDWHHAADCIESRSSKNRLAAQAKKQRRRFSDTK